MNPRSISTSTFKASSETLTAMRPGHLSIGHVCGKGLMLGGELASGRATKEPAAVLCRAVLHKASEHRLLVLSRRRSVARITPALTVTRLLVGELGRSWSPLSEA
jgi:4-aminobutyrate aminotransferase-like enzyme